jgi:tetratricopeptide (TPR) repeat protein
VLAATPGHTDLTEQLVPRLEKAGRQPQADDLFEKVFRVYADGLQTYPDSALLHNNLAWIAARCSRRLDEAQQHAERAVELSPDNAGHLDTLAEVCFQRGDRESAVRHSQRSVQLRPDDETLRRQLDRFQKAK